MASPNTAPLPGLCGTPLPHNASPATAPEWQFSDEEKTVYRAVTKAIVDQKKLSPYYYQLDVRRTAPLPELRKAWSREQVLAYMVWLLGLLHSQHGKLSRREFLLGPGTVCLDIFTQLLKWNKLETPEEARVVGRLLLTKKLHLDHEAFLDYPLKTYVRLTETALADEPVPEELALVLSDILETLTTLPQRTTKKVMGDLRRLLTPAGAAGFRFTSNVDNFAKAANELINQQYADGRLGDLFTHAATATAGKPSRKWRTTAERYLTDITKPDFTALLSSLLELAAQAEVIVETDYYSQSVTHLHVDNNNVVKGLIWMAPWLDSADISRQLAKTAVEGYKKFPGYGPRNTKLGNACIYALAETPGLHGISQIAALSYRIKQTGIRKKVNKTLGEVAERRGVSRQQIEDLSVAKYVLKGDVILKEIGDFTAELRLVKAGKTTLRWQRGEKWQKSIPQAVKTGHPEELKTLKATKKSLETDSATLRDRIDNSMRLDRTMSLAYFNETWRGNTLLNYFAERLLWSFLDSEGAVLTTGYWIDNEWLDARGQAVTTEGATQVRLWHPATDTTKAVKAWRDFLEARELVQPFKQAFREVYILTPAEETTRVYSNRMAAHLLRQHQFAQLARARGWAYTLIGAFDHGMPTQACYQELPEADLRAEFIIQELAVGEDYNPTGIWNHVGTDQVRFLRLENREVVPLTEVPTVLFSEVMRDTDLFVGVASIGNDEAWEDKGEAVFRNYWREYTDRDLTAIGQNRQAALARLIPRLKIRDVAKVGEKYVHVTGTRRQYKIHIGSGNILMEPDDQFLCIVADWRDSSKPLEKTYLPFQGDRTLSIIISKALLLAGDGEITDAVILRQLAR